MRNHYYDQTSLVGFQASLLSLSAALDRAALEGPRGDPAPEARREVQRLRDLADGCDR